jgi:hypothetical protein
MHCWFRWHSALADPQVQHALHQGILHAWTAPASSLRFRRSVLLPYLWQGPCEASGIDPRTIMLGYPLLGHPDQGVLSPFLPYLGQGSSEAGGVDPRPVRLPIAPQVQQAQG